MCDSDDPDSERFRMRRWYAAHPHRHLLEHAAIVGCFALLALWWSILLQDGPQQFGNFVFLAKIVDHAIAGVFFPTIMMMPMPRPEGAGAIVVEYFLFAVTAVVWLNGTVWLTIALAGPLRHWLRLSSELATSLGDLGTLSFHGVLSPPSFQRALPEYLVAAGISAVWASYKYSHVVAVTRAETLEFMALCAVPAALLPLAVMILRHELVKCWMRRLAR